MLSDSIDIIVIGAGIAGVSTAAELSTLANVLLLETESQPGYHATGRSAAYFAPTYGNQVIRTLTKASENFFRNPPGSFTETELIKPRSALFIARKNQVAQVEKSLAELGDKVSVLTGTQTHELVPILAEDYIHQAILDTAGGDLDVDAVLQGYLRMFRASKGSLMVNAQVTSIARHNSTWQVRTQGNTYSAPIVVNAAGAWADDLAASAGINALGLTPKRRTALLIDAPGGFEIDNWPLVVDIDEEFYFKPDAGALLISPADETPSPACDAAPEDLDIAIAVDRFETATQRQVRRVNHKWAGLRTFASDKTPVVGEDPMSNGFFWLAGQGGYGVQTAPAMATLSAAMVLGNEPPKETAGCIKNLSPERFSPS